MSLTILQVLPSLDAGGVERGTLEVAAELNRRGHRSIVLSAGGRMLDQLAAEGTQHITCPIGAKSPFTLRWIPFVRRALLREKVDIVHLRSRVPAWVTYLAWKSLPANKRPRLITTVHGQYSVSRYSRIMTRGETVIAVSNTIRDYILSNYPQTPADTIEVVHRGVNPCEFPHGLEPSQEWRAQFESQFPGTRLASSVPTRPKIITLPGRISRLKGHEPFIQLVGKLLQSGANVHGLIVGEAHPRKKKYEQELRNQISQLGLGAHITMTGHRTDMKEIYAISDIVLSLSSKPESFGRTIVESLALGTPTIGYNHGGVGEILADEFPAGAVPVGDDAQLFNCARSILRAPPTVSLDGYRLATMLNKTVAIYENAIDHRADSASARAA